MIGAKAIPVLVEYLADVSHGLYSRVSAANGLEKIANPHPEARNECLGILVDQLERISENDRTLNGFLISRLDRHPKAGGNAGYSEGFRGQISSQATASATPRL